MNASDGKSSERQSSALLHLCLPTMRRARSPSRSLCWSPRIGRCKARAALVRRRLPSLRAHGPRRRPPITQRLDQSSSGQLWDPISCIMPLALRSYVARQQQGAFETLEWHALLPGIERCWISRADGGEAYLLRCRPGSAILKHRHAGCEAALVLQGGFRDVRGRYRCRRYSGRGPHGRAPAQSPIAARSASGLRGAGRADQADRAARPADPALFPRLNLGPRLGALMSERSPGGSS